MALLFNFKLVPSTDFLKDSTRWEGCATTFTSLDPCLERSCSANMVGFQPLVPALPPQPMPQPVNNAVNAREEPEPPRKKARKKFAGIRVAEDLSGGDRQRNTHLPLGSIPNGARPPVSGHTGAGNGKPSPDNHHGESLSKDDQYHDEISIQPSTNSTERAQKKSNEIKRIIIPTFDLADSCSSSQETLDAKGDEVPEKLGHLRLEVAGDTRQKALYFALFRSVFCLL
jgi:hypothetical protein